MDDRWDSFSSSVKFTWIWKEEDEKGGGEKKNLFYINWNSMWLSKMKNHMNF